MRAKIVCILIMFGIAGISVDAVAEPEANAAPPLLASEYKNTVTLNFGTYNLSKRSQDLYTLGPSVNYILYTARHSTPLANDFDTASRDVYGLEYERHIRYGFSYGLSYFQIRNSFSTPSLIPARGELTAKFYFVTFNKYFGTVGGLQPFIGIGNGQVQAGLGGGVNRSATGNAAQLVAGVRYQTGRVNIVAKYRAVRTSGVGLNGPTDTGSIVGWTDLSGQGSFIGIGVAF